MRLLIGLIVISISLPAWAQQGPQKDSVTETKPRATEAAEEASEQDESTQTDTPSQPLDEAQPTDARPEPASSAKKDEPIGSLTIAGADVELQQGIDIDVANEVLTAVTAGPDRAKSMLESVGIDAGYTRIDATGDEALFKFHQNGYLNLDRAGVDFAKRSIGENTIKCTRTA